MHYSSNNITKVFLTALPFVEAQELLRPYVANQKGILLKGDLLQLGNKLCFLLKDDPNSEAWYTLLQKCQDTLPLLSH